MSIRLGHIQAKPYFTDLLRGHGASPAQSTAPYTTSLAFHVSLTVAFQGFLYFWYLSLVKGLLGSQSPGLMSWNRGTDSEGKTLSDRLTGQSTLRSVHMVDQDTGDGTGVDIG